MHPAMVGAPQTQCPGAMACQPSSEFVCFLRIGLVTPTDEGPCLRDLHCSRDELVALYRPECEFLLRGTWTRIRSTSPSFLGTRECFASAPFDRVARGVHVARQTVLLFSAGARGCLCLWASRALRG